MFDDIFEAVDVFSGGDFVGDLVGSDEIGDVAGDVFSDLGGFGPGSGQIIRDSGIMGGGGRQPGQITRHAQVIPAMGMVQGGVGIAVGLAAKLAGMFGRGSSTILINGVRARLGELWPLVRKYGGTAVAGALGIGLGELGRLLMEAPQHKKRRRRGISGRDVATTRRVVRFVNTMQHQIGCVTRPRRHLVAHKR